ncbi:ATP-binding component of an ABC superfamily methionine transporter [Kluyvera georgiana ATCC 51603]|uniref:ATP-binding component of an ABC superfamily methionine transporter n=1 Tax=Kluyvera georgiana ATCC 51603 TaxID=1354264 RepID=A0A1B7JBZ5_9ENTR|nr:methionine ABC transporter ATP-binding protein [Kluyvera georgiana]OAT45501.1 ATP-binding component of an ABC superfamily methionine transporter [Kluyvera georgiana ATCC 51603]
MTQHPHIRLQGISKTYANGVQALDDISLDIHAGEVFGIIGRSGAGKSTLLRLFNRLESADRGEIAIHGVPIRGDGRRQLRDLRRRVAMIFQHFNLMSTKTVAENVELPLRMAGIPAAERRRRVDDILRLVGLEALRDSWPARLSGGQKQRTGIARALVTQPEILLCDEATSALDPENTLAVLSLLKEINQRLWLTIILITHEMDVIRTLCDRVAVLEKGRVIEQGEVWRVFGDPQHEVTRGMLGTLHHGRVENVEFVARGQQLLTLHFNGANGRGPDLQQIASVLGGGAQLVYSSCEPIQGRVVGQLKIRLPAPLTAERLRLAEQVADSIAMQIAG